ncbi:MAG: aspartate/glutamate racemase family protein [Hyphomonas sp.]|nr:aspartate/glutamate racemase family protein [Hyphomonas sp.]
MTRRIAILGTGDAHTDETSVPEPIRAAVSDGFKAELLKVPGSVFPGTPDARETACQAYVAAGLNAASKGFDALYINTVGDYGLAELRARVSIPVSGSGDASLRSAAMLGSGFSIVTLWPPQMEFIYRQVLEATGAIDGCRGIHFLSDNSDLETMGQEDNIITQIQACQFVPMQTVKSACEAALEGDGSDTVILGCTCMAGMGPSLKQAGLPVIEPMRTGYLAAEMLARL